jgi:DNA-3-methyladenine glycosylase II
MYPSLGDSDLFREGVEHVRKSDRKLRRVIDAHGMLAFKPHGRVFQSLVHSILSQQLNGNVADIIISRVDALFRPGRISPEKLYLIPPARLKYSGVSPQKLSYLKDLSARIVEGRLDLGHLSEKSDEAIVSKLDEVKGIGPWTAHMVLMFSLGRPDVLPVDDYGIKKAIADVYRLPELPKRQVIQNIAKPWHPFRSVACLYLWKHREAGPRA